MKSSIFIFGTDFLHEGYDAVFERLKEQGGLDSVALSATYHNARDIFPHNPKHRVYKHEGDIAWFQPEAARYESGLLLPLAAEADGEDVLKKVCTGAERHGLGVSAWTIFLHNARLGAANPDCVTENLYGDRYFTDLCPANPRVRAYCRELATDIARYPVRSLIAESLHYRTLEHGEHHERYLMDIPAEARSLMSLCFCPDCREAGERVGVVMSELREALVQALEPLWAGDPVTGETSCISDALRDELRKFTRARTEIVTSLAAEIRDALAGTGTEFSFMDHTGAMAHVLPGADPDKDGESIAEKLAIDPVSVAGASDALCVLGYVDETDALKAMLDSYRVRLGEDQKISVGLRPLLPDCHDEANFRSKLDVVANAGVDEVIFYHYAMMPLDRLDWINRALAASAG